MTPNKGKPKGEKGRAHGLEKRRHTHKGAVEEQIH
jgi:hypothetical protein